MYLVDTPLPALLIFLETSLDKFIFRINGLAINPERRERRWTGQLLSDAKAPEDFAEQRIR